MTVCLRLRSRRTPTMSRLSISNSSQAPRDGMILAVKMSLSDVLSSVALEVDAGRADQLRDDDALGAVDDERALVGHEREVAHEDRLGLDLAGLVVHELGGDEQRRGVGEVALLALLDGVLRVLEARVRERQGHRPGEVLDRADLLEDLLQAGLGREVVATFGLDAASTRACQRSLPSSQSKLSICSARRSGTSSGSRILAKEMRREPVWAVVLGRRCARRPRGVLPRAHCRSRAQA